MTTTRQPKGIPAGGQFAATSHTEAPVTLEAPLPRQEALDVSTLAAGEARTLSRDVHQLDGVETLVLKNLGPAEVEGRPRNIISMTYTLPDSSNIAELYDFDDRDRAESHGAAQRAVEDQVGLGGPYVKPLHALPRDGVGLDGEGNLTFVQHDFFSPGEAIDHEDLQSWASEYQQFSDPVARRRLEDAITENYNED